MILVARMAIAILSILWGAGVGMAAAPNSAAAFSVSPTTVSFHNQRRRPCIISIHCPNSEQVPTGPFERRPVVSFMLTHSKRLK